MPALRTISGEPKQEWNRPPTDRKHNMSTYPRTYKNLGPERYLGAICIPCLEGELRNSRPQNKIGAVRARRWSAYTSKEALIKTSTRATLIRATAIFASGRKGGLQEVHRTLEHPGLLGSGRGCRSWSSSRSCSPGMVRMS